MSDLLTKREVHPAAELFPLIEGAEFDAFVKDVKDKGLEVDIVLDRDGKILDGRNRLRACQAAGITPRFTTYTGADPIGKVLSLNLSRRHLTASQRAYIGAQCMSLYEAQAKERQRASGGGTGRAGGDSRTVKENLPQPFNSHQARDDAGATVGVSGRSVQTAKRVIEQAPELVPELKSGELSLNEAERRVIEKTKPKLHVVPVDPPMPSGMKRSPKRSSVDVCQRAVTQICNAVELGQPLDWDSLDADARHPLHADLYATRTVLSQIIKQLEGDISA